MGQVVLLGAGFDCRGMRMPEIATRRAAVFEVDFAEQLAKKRALLERAGVALPDRIRHVACDFTRPQFGDELCAALESDGFRLGAGALFVWEGVAGYLDDAAIDRSLAFMVRAGGSGTRVVFDYGHSRFEPEPADAHVLRAGFTAFESRAFD